MGRGGARGAAAAVSADAQSGAGAAANDVTRYSPLRRRGERVDRTSAGRRSSAASGAHRLARTRAQPKAAGRARANEGPAGGCEDGEETPREACEP